MVFCTLPCIFLTIRNKDVNANRVLFVNIEYYLVITYSLRPILVDSSIDVSRHQ
jgi:hypothetical protein